MTELAQIFKALGDETRLKIVEMLLGKELCVCDILDAFDKTQPVISHHLKILKYAGLVTASRDGKWIYYSIDPRAIECIAGFVSKMKTDLYLKDRQVPCSPNCR
jgi:ArsR family transcriptional regulator